MVSLRPTGWTVPSRRTIGQTLCLVPVVLAPLLGGTAGRPYTLVIAGLCGLVAIFVGIHEQLRRRAVPLSGFAIFLGLGLLLCGLQLVPLPPGLRAGLAPGSDTLLRQILGPLLGYPAHAHALSVDPSATANEALRLASYLVLLLALAAAFSRRGEGLRLQTALIALCAAVAGLGALAALGLTLPAPLGVPAGGVTRAKLPVAFLNSNHLAGFLLIGAVMAAARLSRALSARRPLQVIPIAGLLLLLNTALLGTLSRGGIAAGVLGQAAVLLWPRGIGSGEPRRAGSLRRVLLGLAIPLGGVLLALAVLGEAQRELSARLADAQSGALLAPGSKVQAWREALPLLRGHLWLGVGRGAFEDAFQAHNSIAASTRFPYLENQWLQPFLDFGVPGAVLLWASLGAALWAALRRLRGDWQKGAFADHRVGAFVALCALGLHNVVDFNLEVGGVALPVLLLCALVGRGRVSVPPMALWLGGAAVVVCAIALQPLGRDAAEYAKRLLAQAEGKAPASAVVAAGREAVLRHPLASPLSSIVAARLLIDRDPAALDWANRALLGNPSDISALRTAAVALALQGRGAQAALTLRHAIPRANRGQRLVLYQTVLALRRGKDLSLALRALPESPQVADEVLELVGEGVASARRPRWDELLTLARWADGLGAPSAPAWLARGALAAQDRDEALRQGQRLAQSGEAPLLLSDLVNLLLQPETPKAPAAMPGTDATAEPAAEAKPEPLAAPQPKIKPERLSQVEALLDLAQRRGATPEVLLALAVLREHKGDLPAARQALEQALALTQSPGARAMVLEASAGLEDRQGNVHRAAQLRSEAAAGQE